MAFGQALRIPQTSGSDSAPISDTRACFLVTRAAGFSGAKVWQLRSGVDWSLSGGDHRWRWRAATGTSQHPADIRWAVQVQQISVPAVAGRPSQLPATIPRVGGAARGRLES